ncbi:tolloid-like protein 1 isoform X2 [Gigantopelta aegis]|uniref:tolloid-like protein 1 isoform X2 n=1 Tax=Gigantopelta aegis TaxID=1735272 RepID=UPI001B88C59F|nr:tolloid-like protein 1 isoform X2 [Gigantopelta aegis]
MEDSFTVQKMYKREKRLPVWSCVILAVCLSLGFISAQNCDVIISSLHSSVKNGTFHSPNWPSKYPDNVHCIYKFIGGRNERVQIRFNKFDLQGRAPSCEHDYLDVYAQIKSDREMEKLLDAQMTGRFCGDILGKLPNLIVSTNNVIILSFYTDASKSNKGFSGFYQFIDASIYNIGTEAPPRMCGYTVRSENKMSGYIVSPTFPGMYPDNLFCYYKLQGKPGQRIRLKFHEFLLYHGGDYCPFDYLKIYDGYTSDRPVIGTFCGNYSNKPVLYSSTEALHLEFVTSQGRVIFGKTALENQADFISERKGFNITYEFSDYFVNLDFIQPDSEHVIGTECDQRIMSKKETNGTITSPSYPNSFPQNVTCRYYLDGLMDRQNLEKARITFFDFNIPGNMPYCMIGYVGLNEDSRLGKGAVKEKFCGTLRPPSLSSEGPRLVLTLDTNGAVRGGRFMAKYKFLTDFAIAGIPIGEGLCKFLYDSTKVKAGYFNSPRHPGNYPVDQDCEYIFRPSIGEFVLLAFESFLLEERGPNEAGCLQTDYVAIYEEGQPRNNFTLVEMHCGTLSPGPFVSTRVVKVVFHSDEEESLMGFKASYQFLAQRDMDCGYHSVHGGGIGGVIKSPDYPRKYNPSVFCQWVIKASKDLNRIMLELSHFQLEGKIETMGCASAVVRLYTDERDIRPHQILCGKVGLDKSYISVGTTFKITFVSAPTSLGAKGFQISWTEVNEGASCYGFKCAKNNYCISSELKCNKLPNCGMGDDSDETSECPTTAGIQILHIAIGTSISSFFCIILLICGFYHRRKFRSERTTQDHDHVEVRYVSAPTGCNTTDRLLMEDGHNAVTESPRTCQKVSMV